MLQRPQSKFGQLSDAQWHSGLARLDAVIAAGANAGPVIERYDVLIFVA